MRADTPRIHRVVVELHVDQVRAVIGRDADGARVDNRRRSAELDVVGVDISAGVLGRRIQPNQRRTPILCPNAVNRRDERGRGYLECRPVRCGVSAVEPPTEAEGAVIAWGAVLHATPEISKARHEPTRKNFIKQISKMWPAECCEGATSWDSRTHMAGQIVSEFHTAGE